MTGEDSSEFADSHCDQLNYLRDVCDFKTTYYAHCNDTKSILAAIHDIGEHRYDDIDYPIDGAVIKVDEVDIRKRMGERTKTPKWAIAFKYPAEEKSYGSSPHRAANRSHRSRHSGSGV